MKPKRSVSALLLGSSFLAFSVSAQAATQYWDGGIVNGGNPAANANGGNGDWDNTLTNWDTLAAGGTDAAWSAGNTAVFGGTAGTVTLTSNPITVGGLQFDTTGYILSTGANTLNFGAANNAVLLNNIAAATITGTVGGTGNVILSTSNPATAGTLTLNGTSTGGWTGTTTINAGTTTALAADNQALNNTSGITLNGGNITLTNTSATAITNNRVNNSAITSNGGTFTYTNTAGVGLTYAETIGSVGLNRGQTNFALTNSLIGGSAGDSQTLTLSGLTRTGASNTSAVSFGSAGGLNITDNIVQVAGASGTGPGSGQIIGAWAYYGTTPSAPTDYAVYDASGRVLNASIGATAENSASWTAGGNNVTLGGATTLTGTRTLNTLRYTGGAQTLALDTFNLETNGLLNGGSGLIISSNGGALTTATVGGYLYLTPGNGAITVNAAINDNAGAVTVVKSGSNTLTLGSTTSNYSGGTVLNAGILSTTADSNLGLAQGSGGGGITVNGTSQWTMGVASPVTYNRSLTINEGAVLTLSSGSAAKTVTGVLSGSGSIIGAATTGYIFTNTGNTFTGTVNNGYQMLFASLGDSSNAINLVGSNSEFQWTGGNKTFALRPFTLNAAGTGNINNNGSGALVIEQDLAITGAAGARTLKLGTFLNNSLTFKGNLQDGIGSVLSLNISPSANGSSSNGGTVFLSGTNTYSGATTFTTASNGGFSQDNTLVFQGKQALSPNTAVTLTRGNNGSLAIKLLDDGTGNNGLVSMPTSFTAGAGTTGSVVTFFVGNNNTTNGGNTSGTSTGNTIALNDLTLTQSGGTTNVIGANGYRLQFNNVNLTTANNAVSTTFNPTTAPLTIAGTVRQASSANVGAMTLGLGGTAMGNEISGTILNSADVTPRLLNISKTNTSTWTLSGTNSYTGGTTITTGKLIFSGANSLPTTGTVAVGANGILSLADGTARNQTVSALTLTSLGSLSFDWTGNNTGDQLTSSADITPTANSNFAINLNRSGTPGGSVTLLTGGAGSTLSGSNFYLANLTDYTATLSTPTADTLVVDNYAAQTALTTMYWQGDKLGTGVAGVRNAWALSDGTTSNWSSTNPSYTATALTPGATANVIFANNQIGKTQQSTVLGADVTVNSVVIDDSSAVTIAGANGATLTLMSGLSSAGTVGGTPGSAITVTSNANATSTISSNVILGANQTWNVASGKTLAVSGIVDGAFSLTKADAGTLTLSGSNNYTGTTAINVGQLTITKATGLGTTAGNTTIASTGSTSTGGRLQFLSGSGNAISVAENITITGNSNGGASAINNSGQATVTLSGDITLSSLTGGIRFDTNNGGSNMIFSGTISQTGSSQALIFNTNSSGGQTITVNNSIALNGGTMQVQGTGTSILKGVNATDGTGIGQTNIVAGGILRLGVSNALNITNTLTADGTLDLAGFDQTVNVLTGASTGTVQNTVAGTRTLTVGNGGGSGIFNGTIVTGTGDIQLTKTGIGTQTLAGVNTYTGATTVNQGTLELAAGGSTAAGSAVTVNNSASLIINGTLNGTLLANVSTTVSGTGTINGNANILGTHNPGNSPGIQTYGADLEYSGGASVVNWELGANTTANAANPNANYDQILVGSDLAFTDLTTLNLLFSGGSVLWSDSLWNTDQSWVLYDVAGTTTGFDIGNLTLTTTNWTDSLGNQFNTARAGNTFSLSQSGDNVLINYTVIPEPNTAALLGALGTMLLLRRRR